MSISDYGQLIATTFAPVGSSLFFDPDSDLMIGPRIIKVDDAKEFYRTVYSDGHSFLDKKLLLKYSMHRAFYGALTAFVGAGIISGIANILEANNKGKEEIVSDMLAAGAIAFIGNAVGALAFALAPQILLIEVGASVLASGVLSYALDQYF